MLHAPKPELVTLVDASTPLTKLALVPLPADSAQLELIWTVPVKLVAVLPTLLSAVTLTLNATSLTWPPMLPPPAASTRKLATFWPIAKPLKLVAPEACATVVVGVPTSAGLVQ